MKYKINEILHSGRKGIRNEPVNDFKYDGLVDSIVELKGLNVIEDCKQFDPQVVVIKLGTNDSKTENWKHGDEFYQDMQQMIDELKALPSRPRIFLAYPVKAWKDTWTINDSVITNAIIPTIDQLALENGLEVIDLHTPFSAAEAEPLMQRDGIHPRAEGAKKMAEIICQAIKTEPKVVKKIKKKAKSKRKK